MTRTGAPGRPRPLRADAERNRLRVLAAAREVFARRGLDAGLDEIARHAGLGVGTVYRRFPDRTVLVEAMIEQRLEELLELATVSAALDDPWEGLVRFVTGAVELQVADRALRDLLFGGDRCGERLDQARDRLRPAVSGLVERARAAGAVRADLDATDVACALLMLDAVGCLFAPVRPDAWRRQLAILLDGLRPPPDGAALPTGPLGFDELDVACRGPGRGPGPAVPP